MEARSTGSRICAAYSAECMSGSEGRNAGAQIHGGFAEHTNGNAEEERRNIFTTQI